MPDCSACVSEDECKYKEEFLKAKNIIDNEATVFDDLIDVHIHCKHCTKVRFKITVPIRSTP